MTTPRLSLLLGVGIALAVAAARGRGDTAAADADAHAFTVTGTVTAPPANGHVMVAHDDIAGYMPAMTMPFALAPGEAPRLAPGSKVRFRLRVDGADSRADRFEVTGHDAAVAAAAAAPSPTSATRLRRGDAVPAFALIDQAGAPFGADHLLGRRTVITFIFTRCPVPEFCPLMVQRLREIDTAAAGDPRLRDLRFVAVTLDPANDTPAVLGAYAEAKQLDAARWRLVTGSADEIARLTRAFAVHVERNGVLLDHTLATALVDADGQVVEIWRGNGWKAREVVEVLRGGPALTE